MARSEKSFFGEIIYILKMSAMLLSGYANKAMQKLSFIYSECNILLQKAYIKIKQPWYLWDDAEIDKFTTSFESKIVVATIMRLR
jgi:hypothetical protein